MTDEQFRNVEALLISALKQPSLNDMINGTRAALFALQAAMVNGSTRASEAAAGDPVAWIVTDKIYGSVSLHVKEADAREFKQARYTVAPLYAAPQPASEQSLTAAYRNALEHIAGSCEGRAVEVAKTALSQPASEQQDASR